MTLAPTFWRTKSLAAMTEAEWEALCDGCGRCCLLKLEDAETGELYFTNVACRLLDLTTCRCTHYADRARRVPDCTRLTLANLGTLRWLPRSCAYRRLAEGRALPDWHHLVSGDPLAVHRAGASVRGWTLSEQEAGDPEDHVIDRLP